MAMLGGVTGMTVGGVQQRQRFRYEVNVIMDANIVEWPHLDVPKEQLQYFLSMGFSRPQISTTIALAL